MLYVVAVTPSENSDGLLIPCRNVNASASFKNDENNNDCKVNNINTSKIKKTISSSSAAAAATAAYATKPHHTNLKRAHGRFGAVNRFVHVQIPHRNVYVVGLGHNLKIVTLL